MLPDQPADLVECMAADGCMQNLITTSLLPDVVGAQPGRKRAVQLWTTRARSCGWNRLRERERERDIARAKSNNARAKFFI